MPTFKMSEHTVQIETEISEIASESCEVLELACGIELYVDVICLHDDGKPCPTCQGGEASEELVGSDDIDSESD